MRNLDKHLSALRAKQKALARQISREATQILSQYLRGMLVLIVTTAVYGIMLKLLQNLKKKKDKSTPKAPSARASSHHSKRNSLDQQPRFVQQLLRTLLSKVTAESLKRLSPYLRQWTSGWITSLLLTILPWALRKLFDELKKKT